jgi:hypothetical protein
MLEEIVLGGHDILSAEKEACQVGSPVRTQSEGDNQGQKEDNGIPFIRHI